MFVFGKPLNKKFFLALAILIGLIIGAGIFGIPYVIARSGLLLGFFYFLILGGSVLLLHLFFGEIVLRTKEKHRLIGYSEKYLGNFGKTLITISTILGTTGVLLAYLILGGEFLEIIFSPFLNISAFHFSFIFWFFLIYFILKGIKTIAPLEVFTNSIFFLLFFIIFYFLFPQINLEKFTLFNLENVFLPYGVIMFALMGFVAIPEMADILKTPEERKSLRKVIIFSSIIIIIFYLLFSLAVVGVSGGETSSNTLHSLEPFLRPEIMILLALIAVITLADSFLVIALYLKNALIYDYRLHKNLAFLFACGLPLFLFSIGFRNFILVIGIVGSILAMFEGIVILLIFSKIRKLGDREPEYSLKVPRFLLFILGAILIFGAISQVVYYLK